jgi:hypothetical protein
MSRPRKPCRYCGHDHPSSKCRSRPPSDAPLETPSHNGVYQGTIKPREIPAGVSGDWKMPNLSEGRRGD